MTIIYYTNADGKITHYHKARECSREELDTLAAQYNGKPENANRPAYIAELHENSLEEYLYRRFRPWKTVKTASSFARTAPTPYTDSTRAATPVEKPCARCN